LVFSHDTPFGIAGLLLRYCQTAEYRVTRQKAMCTWIKELLKDMRLESWAGVFKVASVEFQTLYDHALFESAVWFRPDSDTPVRLFD
jgi:hypothetical protein